MARDIPDTVIEMLHNVPLLSTCNKKELRQIANLGTHLSVAEGAVLTEQGQPGTDFFLLLRGGPAFGRRRISG